MKFTEQALVFAPMYVSLFWTIFLILEPKTKNLAKHFLGFFMIAAMLVYVCHAAFFTNHQNLYLFLDPIYVAASLMVYPLYYWYIKLLTEETTYKLQNIWHLLPAIILFTATTVVYLFMEDPTTYILMHLFERKGLSAENKAFWSIQQVLYFITRTTFFAQIVLYLYWGFKKIKVYEKQVEDFYSNLEGRRIGWAKWLLIIFSATAITSAIANLIGRAFFTEKQGLVIIPALIFSSLIFLIGYWGFKQSHTIINLRDDENNEEKNMLQKPTKFKNDNYNESVNQPLSPLQKNLISLFENDKIYTIIDLKISQVGQLLNTNRTYVSKLINDEFGCSFSDFVSKYRVREAKEILRNKQFDDLPLEDVAEMAGFSSAAALIRIFKQYEGTTPGNFRKRNGGS